MADVQWEEYIHQNMRSRPPLPSWVSAPPPTATRRPKVSHTTVNAAGQTGSSWGSPAEGSGVLERNPPRLRGRFQVRCLCRAKAPQSGLAWGDRGSRRRGEGMAWLLSRLCVCTFLKGRCAPCTSWSLRFRLRAPWLSTVFLQGNEKQFNKYAAEREKCHLLDQKPCVCIYKTRKVTKMGIFTQCKTKTQEAVLMAKQ